jgi:hypothetical protein
MVISVSYFASPIPVVFEVMPDGAMLASLVRPLSVSTDLIAVVGRWHWDAPLIISPHRPTRLYFAGPNAKVEIALARGKDVGDKRQTIKEREMKREMERAIRR